MAGRARFTRYPIAKQEEAASAMKLAHGRGPQADREASGMQQSGNHAGLKLVCPGHPEREEAEGHRASQET